MSQEELILETNLLLQKVLDLHKQRREEGEQAMKKMDEQMREMKQKREELMRSKLEEHGVPPEVAAMSEDAFEVRRKEAMGRSEANLAEIRKLDEEYKEALLSELRVQSELLRQIAEKVQS